MRQRGASPGPTPTPIPVQGDVQIFADENCLAYPTIGEAYEDLFARINVPWGFNESWGESSSLWCDGPSTIDPDVGYRVVFLTDFESDESETPFTAGQVLLLHEDYGGQVIEDGTSFVYTKP